MRCGTTLEGKELNKEFERLTNIAKRLGYNVVLLDSENYTSAWSCSRVFFEFKRISLGTRYERNLKKRIPKKVLALVLAHEIGHILVRNTIFQNCDLLTYDSITSDNTHNNAQNEIWVWKTVFEDELTEENRLAFELAQEAINEHIFCWELGSYVANEIKEEEERIIAKFTERAQRL